MTTRPRHLRVAFAIAVLTLLTAAAAAAIAFVTKSITGRASPLPATPPWEWSGTDIAQWFSNRATSDSVIDVVTQVFATIAWLALAYIAWILIRELADQTNHGVIDTRAPRTRHRSTSRRPRPAFATSFVALLLGATTLTLSTATAVGLPQRAPAVMAAETTTVPDTIEIRHVSTLAAESESALPAGMTWTDYTVTRADESLRSIAADLSGDPDLARTIWTANQHRDVAPNTAFNDPTIVQQGWTLRIPVPVGSTGATSAAAATASEATAAADDRYKTVVPGDTLYEMIGDVIDEPVTTTHVEAVAARNDGAATPGGAFEFSATNPDLIHPGQVFDLQPAIDLAVGEPADVADELPPPAPQDPNQAPTAEPPPQTETPTAEADSPEDNPTIDDALSDAPDAAGQPDRIRLDETPPVAEAAPTTPAVTTPAPPTPIPADAVAVPSAQPGDAAATLPPAAETTVDDAGRSGIPIELLAVGGLSLAGLFIALDRRRRIARAQRPLGRAVAAPDPAVEHDEQIMRAAAHIDRATRVNLAVRQLGAHLAERDAPLRSRYVLADSSTVTVVFDRNVELGAGWAEATIRNGWTCALTDDELEPFATVSTPWPALVPIGTLDNGTDVLIDVEGVGALAIDGPPAVVDSVLSAIVTSLASSPFADLLTLSDDNSVGLHGLDTHLQHRLAVDSVDTLLDRLSAWVAPLDFDDQHLIAARHEFGGELEPCIAAVVTDLSDAQRTALSALPFDGSRPIALITTDTTVASTVFDVDDDGTTRLDGQRIRLHRLDPVAAAVAATLFDIADIVEVSDASPLDDYRTVVAEPDETRAREPDEPHSDTDVGVSPSPAAMSTLEIVGTVNGVPAVPAQLFDTEPEAGWHVRNLGPLEIVHTNGTHLKNMRELFTLLSMHPAGLTAAEINDKLEQSKDPTAHKCAAGGSEGSVTPGASKKASEGRRARYSDLRKALGQGDALAGRTYLPMHSKARGYHVEGIRVDSVRFVKCLEAAEGAVGQDKVNWLVGALQLVRGQINTGELTKYAWATRILSPLEACIVDAGIELAQLAADSGNWTVADWAANQVRVANPYDQRGLPIQVQARQALGDEVGIRRLHDEAIDTVDELEPDVHDVFIHALAQ